MNFPQGGEVIAKTIYARVTVSDGYRERLSCVDLDTKQTFDITGKPLIEQFVSGSQYTEEREVTMTDLARTFVSVGALPFTVCFLKADKSLRELSGHMVEHEDLLGRSMVVDFDVTSGTPLRQVDHRTLQWLIVGGIKYNLKKGK